MIATHYQPRIAATAGRELGTPVAGLDFAQSLHLANSKRVLTHPLELPCCIAVSYTHLIFRILKKWDVDDETLAALEEEVSG